MVRKFKPAEGAGISILGLLAGAGAWILAPLQSDLLVRIVFLLFAWFALWFFVHDLTHHIVGTLGGIRFRYYFLGKSAIRKLKLPIIPRLMEFVPVLVLKVDRKSYDGASPKARKWMHASGALVSIILPVAIIPSAFSIGPLWVGVLFTSLIIGNGTFTLYFSPKTGDLYRARLSGK